MGPGEPAGQCREAAAAAMVAQGRQRESALAGPHGLLKLFANALETALNGELTEHLGHKKSDADPDRGSTNVRNGPPPKTVISDDAASEVETDVPRDRESTFEPKIVMKRQRRLTDVDAAVLSFQY